METRESIEQILDKSGNIKKAKKSIVLSVILIVAGIASIYASQAVTESGILSPLCMVAGIIFLGWGIVSIFFRKTYYISTENKQKVSFYDILFDIKERDRLIRLVDEDNIKEVKKLKPAAQDALRLRVGMTPDGNVCFSQVITYIPFEFVNANDVHSHTADDAKTIKEIIKER